MFNKFLTVLGIFVIVAGFAMLVLPVSRIPLLDANRQVLAESEREGYCAGVTYAETSGAGDRATARACRSENPRSNEINLAVTQRAFCQGLVWGGFSITLQACISVVPSNRLWPTMDGSITNAWNGRFPYPGDMIASAQLDDESRTGDRNENVREGLATR